MSLIFLIFGMTLTVIMPGHPSVCPIAACGLAEQLDADVAALQEHKMAPADGQLDVIMPNCKWWDRCQIRYTCKLLGALCKQFFERAPYRERLRADFFFISQRDRNVNFQWARAGLKRTVELDGWCPFEVVITFNDSPKVCEAPWRTQDVSSSSHSPRVCQAQTPGSLSLSQGRFGRLSFHLYMSLWHSISDTISLSCTSRVIMSSPINYSKSLILKGCTAVLRLQT